MCAGGAQGNYSDLLVQLSNIYSQLRGDVSGVKNEDASQGFVRSTTKYWVRMTDVSAVKHHILQHLPVFQYNQGSVRSFPPAPLSLHNPILPTTLNAHHWLMQNCSRTLCMQDACKSAAPVLH